ncbi:MAG: hypothetical protein KC609_14450 [Myxococcales bacterium]|nr:hypothetical protein [Myxococcales bacterium]
MKRWIVAVVLGLLTLGGGRLANAYSLLGGETLRVDENAIHAGIGFPDLTFSYHIPITSNFELAPKFTFFYGGEDPRSTPFLGNTFTLVMRYAFIKGPKFNLALHVDFGFIFAYYPGGFGFGIRLGTPSVVMNYNITPKISLVGGFLIPLAFAAYPHFFAQIPIVFRLGGEFAFTSAINGFVLIEVGPNIYAANGGSFVGVYFRANVGVQYKF